MDAEPLLKAAYVAFGYFHIVAAIWSFVILLKCLSEVHGFSVWRSFFTTILVILVVAIPILVILALSAIGAHR